LTETDDCAMSWENPEPPVLDYWYGLAVLAVTTLGSGLVVYALLA
jgi:hypothetical protein